MCTSNTRSEVVVAFLFFPVDFEIVNRRYFYRNYVNRSVRARSPFFSLDFCKYLFACIRKMELEKFSLYTHRRYINTGKNDCEIQANITELTICLHSMRKSVFFHFHHKCDPSNGWQRLVANTLILPCSAP